jgi:hypothetical protein
MFSELLRFLEELNADALSVRLVRNGFIEVFVMKKDNREWTMSWTFTIEQIQDPRFQWRFKKQIQLSWLKRERAEIPA